MTEAAPGLPGLVEFLLARITEDEWLSGYWLASDAAGSPDRVVGGHASGPYRPARALAECEAKRRIISRCDMVLRGRGAGMFNDGQATDAADNLRSLALPYADHPDFDESWRV